MGRLEPTAVGMAVWIDPVAVGVDDHMMVVPAEQRQIVGGGWPALMVGRDVVGLEAVSALASIGGAHPVVAEGYETLEGRRNGVDRGVSAHRLSLVEEGDADPAAAEEFFEQTRTHPDSTLDLGSTLSTLTGSGREAGVDENHCGGDWAFLAAAAFEAVLTDGHEGVRPELSGARTQAWRRGGESVSPGSKGFFDQSSVSTR